MEVTIMKISNPLEQVYSSREAATLWGVAENTVTQWCESGTLRENERRQSSNVWLVTQEGMERQTGIFLIDAERVNQKKTEYLNTVLLRLLSIEKSITQYYNQKNYYSYNESNMKYIQNIKMKVKLDISALLVSVYTQITMFEDITQKNQYKDFYIPSGESFFQIGKIMVEEDIEKIFDTLIPIHVRLSALETATTDLDFDDIDETEEVVKEVADDSDDEVSPVIIAMLKRYKEQNSNYIDTQFAKVTQLVAMQTSVIEQHDVRIEKQDVRMSAQNKNCYTSSAETNMNNKKIVAPSGHNEIQDRVIKNQSKKDRPRAKEAVSGEMSRKRLADYDLKQHKVNQELLNLQHKHKVEEERKRLIKSICSACNRIPDIFGRCGCS
jgi:hypothetical protein